MSSEGSPRSNSIYFYPRQKILAGRSAVQTRAPLCGNDSRLRAASRQGIPASFTSTSFAMFSPSRFAPCFWPPACNTPTCVKLIWKVEMLSHPQSVLFERLRRHRNSGEPWQKTQAAKPQALDCSQGAGRKTTPPAQTSLVNLKCCMRLHLICVTSHLHLMILVAKV